MASFVGLDGRLMLSPFLVYDLDVTYAVAGWSPRDSRIILYWGSQILNAYFESHIFKTHSCTSFIFIYVSR